MVYKAECNLKNTTINIPSSYVDALDILISESGIYPSRAEAVRVAVRNFLIKELKKAKRAAELNKLKEAEPVEEGYVKIPQEKVYKIIRRLE